MLDHLLDLSAPYVEAAVIVANPSFSRDIAAHVDREWNTRLRITIAEQTAPTGMLDAILLGHAGGGSRQPDAVWIVWCDQVGLLPATLARLASETEALPPPAMVFPTVWRADSYIHFDRDAQRPDPAGAAAARGRQAARRQARATSACSRCRARPSRSSCPALRARCSRARAPASATSCRSFRGWPDTARSSPIPCTDPDGGDGHQHAGGPARGRSTGCGRGRPIREDAVDRHPRLQRGALHRHAARADQGRRSAAAGRRDRDHRRRRLLARTGRPRSSRRRRRARCIRHGTQRRQGPGGPRRHRAPRPATT